MHGSRKYFELSSTSSIHIEDGEKKHPSLVDPGVFGLRAEPFEAVQVILELPPVLDCDPMKHLLVINLEGDRGKARREHVKKDGEPQSKGLTYGVKKVRMSNSVFGDQRSFS